jgi:hypothetical protein
MSHQLKTASFKSEKYVWLFLCLQLTLSMHTRVLNTEFPRGQTDQILFLGDDLPRASVFLLLRKFSWQWEREWERGVSRKA